MHCIHWVSQSTKQNPFIIHASSFNTICVLSFSCTCLQELEYLCMLLQSSQRLIEVLWNPTWGSRTQYVKTFEVWLKQLKSTTVEKEMTPLGVLKQAASMIKGKGKGLFRCPHQPGNSPPRNIRKKKLVWVRGVVCRGTQTHTLSVVV